PPAPRPRAARRGGPRSHPPAGRPLRAPRRPRIRLYVSELCSSGLLRGAAGAARADSHPGLCLCGAGAELRRAGLCGRDRIHRTRLCLCADQDDRDAGLRLGRDPHVLARQFWGPSLPLAVIVAISIPTNEMAPISGPFPFMTCGITGGDAGQTLLFRALRVGFT